MKVSASFIALFFVDGTSVHGILHPDVLLKWSETPDILGVFTCIYCIELVHDFLQRYDTDFFNPSEKTPNKHS